ncbi:MAG: hypothetical protein NVS3B20_22700 [Polyangiales bacterium]
MTCEKRRRVHCGPASYVREGMMVRIPIIPPFHYVDESIGLVRVRGAVIARKNGRIYAYANVCRHIPLTLDLGDGEVASADGLYFLCHHHGARYRIESGACVSGPCDGEALVPLDVETVFGELSLVLPDEPTHQGPPVIP